ncbi:MAG TPA: hypothetical protein VIQ74_12370 [Gemmatimonadaceae bacterium]
MKSLSVAVSILLMIEVAMEHLDVDPGLGDPAGQRVELPRQVLAQWPPDWRDYYALVAWRFDAPDSVRLTDCLAHARSCQTLADTGRHAELIRRPHPRQFPL